MNRNDCVTYQVKSFSSEGEANEWLKENNDIVWTVKQMATYKGSEFMIIYELNTKYRFQNTLRDLEDCYDQWTESLEKGSEEYEAREKLYELCKKIVHDYET